MKRRRGADGTVRGVVLGAGFGTRLRPLTLAWPKPLLPVGGRPILYRTLAELDSLGCESVAINLHHLPEKIPAAIGDQLGAMPIHYFPETEILGTLGALEPMTDWFSGAELVVLINGDSLCRWPLERLVDKHLTSGAEATILTTSFADPKEYGGGITVTEDGEVVAFRGAIEGLEENRQQRRVFAGAHVFSPQLVEGLSSGFADIVRDLYEPMVAAGRRITSYDCAAQWYDLGTPRRYLDGAIAWSCGRLNRFTRVSWPRAMAEASASVKRAVIEPGATLGEACEIERSLILPGASVGAGCHVRESIIGFDVELPAGTGVEGRMVTNAQAGMANSPGASSVDQLVYTPIPESPSPAPSGGRTN